VTKVFEFGGGKVREHIGGIYDYLRERGTNEICGVNKSNMVEPQKPQKMEAQASVANSYAERKEQQKRLKRAEKAVEESEKKIAKMEQRLKELDSLLCDPKNASDMTLVTEYTDIKRALDEEVGRWEQLEEELEAMRSEE
jgi:ATP-binding cassette subfamily F protein 3